MKREPKLTLVGAGPGDPELITLKGLKALSDADVILYDALVNPELLKYSKTDCRIIFAGKRAKQHSFSQDEINRMIVDYAFQFGHVVRLKGGDPFVFGRGHEELSYALSFKIKTDIIPGISSAVAVPELQQIPLTKRHINESFWVITGTTSGGELSEDICRAAETNATVIILMGLGRLKEISEIFINKGKAELPAAVIQNGSLPDEKIVVSTVENIYSKCSELNFFSPSVIVFGEVAALHPEFETDYKNSIVNT